MTPTTDSPPVGSLPVAATSGAPSPASTIPTADTSMAPGLIRSADAPGLESGARLVAGDVPSSSYDKGEVGLSAARSSEAGEALDLLIARVKRGHRSFPPSVLPALMRALLEIKRLEGGESTANVAHAGLSPEARRARILELVSLSGELPEAGAAS